VISHPAASLDVTNSDTLSRYLFVSLMSTKFVLLRSKNSIVILSIASLTFSLFSLILNLQTPPLAAIGSLMHAVSFSQPSGSLPSRSLSTTSTSSLGSLFVTVISPSSPLTFLNDRLAGAIRTLPTSSPPPSHAIATLGPIEAGARQQPRLNARRRPAHRLPENISLNLSFAAYATGSLLQFVQYVAARLAPATPTWMFWGNGLRHDLLANS
jgi:hypothetical protein